MPLTELLLWMSQSGLMLLLHLSARASFPQPLDGNAEQEMIARMFEGDRALPPIVQKIESMSTIKKESNVN
ncbi:MAG: hypothetical protein IJI59_10505 [Clostridia bacterium]|nr:hypothetical protein [Clostridia bacterium]